ncbi:hypothetical protein IHE55_18770 [Streptomyces pactum]|uniref:Uncharacterized protein n=1 Tax=Streptomyces pactum TaxID=68249 RepID=A0ABS0NNC4_9ACTN|nr:hypothetical protein [Streptomyces pactum]MBH5336703.1 hypothetical protein [Streptomyces pactum]
MLRKLRRESRTVQSALGWPVQSAVMMATPEKMSALIKTASESGFSRKGKGLNPQKGHTFAIIPYAPEPTPIPSWMCLVIEFQHGMQLDNGIRPKFHFGRLDISKKDIKDLPSAKRRTRDQILHWMAWQARLTQHNESQ